MKKAALASLTSLSLGSLLSLASLATDAWAVPDTVTFTGRLKNSQGPVTGSVNLVFRMYDAPTGGNQVWTETRNAVGANEGLVYVELGQDTSMDEVVFDGQRLFLEVQVGDEVLAPRMAFNSVGYAIRAGSADSASSLGTITPEEV